MIYSMTAFAKAQSQQEWGTISCEIKSVNSRYLDLKVSLPELVKSLDADCYHYLRQHLQRGKVDCRVCLNTDTGLCHKQVQVNHDLVQKLIATCQTIAHDCSGSTTLNVLDVLKWPGVIVSNELITKDLTVLIMQLLAQATTDILSVRLNEGEKLRQLLVNRLVNINQQLIIIKNLLPHVLEKQRQKLLNYVAGIPDFTPQALAHELLVFAQKIDVTEEIERLDIHVAEVNKLLALGGRVGRRLDFFMQELQRESNTLGAKSSDVNITYAVLEIKVLIEQLREQIQNIE